MVKALRDMLLALNQPADLYRPSSHRKWAPVGAHSKSAASGCQVLLTLPAGWQLAGPRVGALAVAAAVVAGLVAAGRAVIRTREPAERALATPGNSFSSTHTSMPLPAVAMRLAISKDPENRAAASTCKYGCI